MSRSVAFAAGVLLFVVALCAAAVAAPMGGSAELARLNAEILAQPNNTALNLQYASLAEQLGKPRLALAAYERILIYDPQNDAAFTGIQRIRAQLQPETTKWLLGLGGGAESNPLYLPSTGLAKYEGQGFGFLNMRDERHLWGYNWRTLANVDGIIHGEQVHLDYGHAAAATGPVLLVLPGLQAYTAIGAAGAYFGSHPFYSEAAASATFEMYPSGAYEAIMIKAAYRNYDQFYVPERNGSYVEVAGKFTMPLAVPDFALRFSPWVRWNSIEGPFGPLPPAVALFPFSPGNYTDAGARIEADYSPFPWIVLGANFTGFARYYRKLPVDAQLTNERDTIISPGAMVLFPHVIDSQTDLRFDYKYIHDITNNPGFVFVDRVVTATVLRRF